MKKSLQTQGITPLINSPKQVQGMLIGEDLVGHLLVYGKTITQV